MIRTANKIVWTVTCTFAAGTTQAAPDMFEGQASIRNLAVEVIDLRPDDGIAPGFVAGKHQIEGSAQWFSDGYLFAFDDGYGGDLELGSTQTKQSLKGIMGGPDFQFQLPDGQATFGRTSGNYFARVTVKAEDIWLPSYTGPNSAFRTEMKVSTQSWLLKPGTEVRISGNFDLSMHNDPSQLTPDLVPDNGYWGPWHYAELFGYMSLSQADGGEGVIVGPGGETISIRTDALAANEQLIGSSSQSFVLVARNTGNQDVILQSDFAVGAKYQLALTVPEPSSWAMGLVGFGLAGLFARRRQAA